MEQSPAPLLLDRKTAAAVISYTDWLTAAEAAAYLKINPKTLRSWARQGKVPGHPLSGSQRITWRFLRAELDAILSPSSAVPADRRQH